MSIRNEDLIKQIIRNFEKCYEDESSEPYKFRTGLIEVSSKYGRGTSSILLPEAMSAVAGFFMDEFILPQVVDGEYLKEITREFVEGLWHNLNYFPYR